MSTAAAAASSFAPCLRRARRVGGCAAGAASRARFPAREGEGAAPGGAELGRLPEPYSRPRAGSAQSAEGAARRTRVLGLTQVQRLGRTDGASGQTHSGR